MANLLLFIWRLNWRLDPVVTSLPGDRLGADSTLTIPFHEFIPPLELYVYSVTLASTLLLIRRTNT